MYVFFLSFADSCRGRTFLQLLQWHPGSANPPHSQGWADVLPLAGARHEQRTVRRRGVVFINFCHLLSICHQFRCKHIGYFIGEVCCDLWKHHHAWITYFVLSFSVNAQPFVYSFRFSSFIIVTHDTFGLYIHMLHILYFSITWPTGPICQIYMSKWFEQHI